MSHFYCETQKVYCAKRYQSLILWGFLPRDLVCMTDRLHDRLCTWHNTSESLIKLRLMLLKMTSVDFHFWFHRFQLLGMMAVFKGGQQWVFPGCLTCLLLIIIHNVCSVKWSSWKGSGYNGIRNSQEASIWVYLLNLCITSLNAHKKCFVDNIDITKRENQEKKTTTLVVETKQFA